MKLISVCLVAVVFVLCSCKKSDDDPGLSSADGKWAYTTPDAKMSVSFELVKSTNGYKVQNAKLTVDGTVAETVTMPDEVTAPTFATLRFSANDAKLTYPYSLLFANATISSDFKQIAVATGEYTFPWGTTKNLSDIIIRRP